VQEAKRWEGNPGDLSIKVEKPRKLSSSEKTVVIAASWKNIGKKPGVHSRRRSWRESQSRHLMGRQTEAYTKREGNE